MTTAIIGGGAAGLMAAITASESGGVILLERQARLGRKLAVTGNGRCNLTNMSDTSGRYHGADAEFPKIALSRFDAIKTRAFFRSIGLLTVEEEDRRVYPFSNQAGSVLDVLRLEASARGVDIRTGYEVTGARACGGGFIVTANGEEIRADKLIVAAGGVAGTRAGSTDLGYRILEAFGHTKTKLYPALVQLKTENSFTRPLNGVRADCGVEAISNGKRAALTAGEVQFTDYGVSGPAIFEISRAVTTSKDPVTIRLDLLRALDANDVAELIRRSASRVGTLENLLTGAMHNKLGRTVLTKLGYSLASPASALREADIDKIARFIKRCELSVTGSLGMDGAQVTAGGIRTSEFDPATMQSRLVPGLYAAGEVLDVDGDCGGFNLQWAWSSGRLAGELGGGAL